MEVLTRLTHAYRLVALVTGRRSQELIGRLDVPHLRVYGLYGMEDLDAPEVAIAARPLAERAAAEVPEAWVEDKGPSLAVHYRQAPDPLAARSTLLVALTPVATETGLELIEGKMVIELVPPDRPLKGGAVERLAGEHELEAALYAGDDHADLDAFVALDRLAARGVATTKVAVRGRETPEALLASADVAVDGPVGLVGLLETLV